jgi:hypothetical protein
MTLLKAVWIAAGALWLLFAALGFISILIEEYRK